MRSFSSKLVVSLLALVSAVAPAAAQDKKNYPGTMCQASGTAETRIERPSSGRATNLGPDAMTFQCPAVKDGSSIAGATVHVIDEDPNGSVSCTLRSRDLSGSIGAETRASSAADHGSTPVALTFGSQSGASFGYYILSCAVPAPFATSTGSLRSGVVTYQINEND
jgi:hypothetical protein